MAFLNFGLWWIFWVHVCPWLIRAPKMLQLRTNQLVVWFVQVHVSNWITCHSSYSPSQNSNTSFYPKVLRARERAPTPYPFVVFTLDSHLSLLSSLGVRQHGSFAFVHSHVQHGEFSNSEPAWAMHSWGNHLALLHPLPPSPPSSTFVLQSLNVLARIFLLCQVSMVGQI